MHKPSLLALSLCSISLVACGDDPPSPDEVRTRIAIDLGGILHTANAAATAIDTVPGSAAFSMIEGALGASGSELTERVRSQIADHLAARPGEGRAFAAPEDGEAPFDPDQVIEELNTKLFSDANHLGEGIYDVPASLVCTTTDLDNNGDLVESIDPACAEDLATAQLRIRVSLADDTMRFALQIGADHVEPLEVALAASSVSLTVDLDEAWKAAAALAPLFGEDLPAGELEGQLTAKLEVLGSEKVRGSLAIDRDLRVALAETDPADPSHESFRFTSQKSEVLAVTLDGKAQSGGLAVDLKATTFQATEPGEDFELDLPGFTAGAQFAAGEPLQITGVSLGDRTTTVSVNGVRAASIDLNPGDGRALGATISLDAATGAETLAVTPKLDLRMAFDHAALGDEPPVYAVTQLLVDGSLRSRPDSDAVEVLAGTLALATDPATYGFTATTGQCATPVEAIDATTERFYTQWTVGTCE